MAEVDIFKVIGARSLGAAVHQKIIEYGNVEWCWRISFTNASGYAAHG
jgi:hypothetical protein